MKKNLMIGLIGAVVLALVWNATTAIISTFSGIGGMIPPELVNNNSYEAHLEHTLKNADHMTFEELRQDYKEKTEFEIKYVRLLQRVLRKFAKTGLVES